MDRAAKIAIPKKPTVMLVASPAWDLCHSEVIEAATKQIAMPTPILLRNTALLSVRVASAPIRGSQESPSLPMLQLLPLYIRPKRLGAKVRKHATALPHCHPASRT